MKTRKITVNIKTEPKLYDALMMAMNGNTDHDGWRVMQYTERRGDEGRTIAEFTLREADPISSRPHR